MQRREKILLVMLLTAVGVGVVGPRVRDVLWGEVDARALQLSLAQKRLDVKDQESEIARVKLAKRKVWKSQALPADPQTAVRLYQHWLTNLAEDVGKFSKLKIMPKPVVTNRRKVYVVVGATLTAEGTMSQVRDFLVHFYGANLLHRLSRLSLESQGSAANSPLIVSLTAEGLSLPDATPRGETLFPRTSLSAKVLKADTAVSVLSAEFFPKTVPFQVRIGGEFLKVTGVDGTSWTVERGAGPSMAADHAQQDVVELAESHPDMRAKSLSDYESVIAMNLFAKPRKYAPQKPNAAPVIDRIDEQTVVLGRELSFTVKATDDGTAANRMAFRLGDGAPDGAAIDAATGRFRWTVPHNVAPGSLEISIKATDDGNPPQTGSRTVSVKVLEDLAEFTYLTASIAADAQREAWFHDRLNNRRLVLKEGELLKYGGIEATVVSIGRDFILLKTGDEVQRLPLGSNLRAMQPVASPNDRFEP